MNGSLLGLASRQTDKMLYNLFDDNLLAVYNATTGLHYFGVSKIM